MTQDVARLVDQYDRARSKLPRSMAGQRFRVDSKSVNDYFWASHLAAGGLAYELKQHSGAEEPIQALGVPAAVYERRLGHSVESVREMAKVHSRWRRLLTLVLLSAALERYVISAAKIAIASDPAVIPGFPKRLDGLYTAKHAVKTHVPDVSSLMKGPWSARTKAYRSLFGQVPAGLSRAEGELEHLRRTRNQIAHSLGLPSREANAGESLLAVTLGAKRPEALAELRISDSRLQTLMKVVGGVVDAVDAHLMSDHIGGYEVAALYLEWLKGPERFEERAAITLAGASREHSLRFGKAIGQLTGHQFGRPYLRSMKRYVDAL